MTAPIRRSAEGWRDLLSRIPTDIAAELDACHSEPGRFYHDGPHPGGLWATFLALGGSPDDLAVLWAAATHDAKYRAGAPKGENEEGSRVMLERFGTRVGLDGRVLVEGMAMVQATADHLGSPLKDIDEILGFRTHLFCDLDLAGFADGWEGFSENSRLVRMEYPTISDPDFRVGRNGFFGTLVDRDSIYQSDFVPSWWKYQARANITRELAEDR